MQSSRFMRRVVTFLCAHAGAVFWSLVAASMLIHAMTMSYSPVHWIDDVMINEIARGGLFHKDSDWSLVWNPIAAASHKPWTVMYLGGLVLEIGYQLFGHLGPRVLTMGWLLILTALVVVYVRRKTGRNALSYLCGILCFTAPCLTQSARGARVDVMSVAFMFMALCVLQLVACARMKRIVVFALAGAFVALSAFTWLPGLMVAPLVGWEILERFRREGSTLKEAVLELTVTGIAFIVACAILLTPFYPDVLEPFVGAQKAVATVSNNGAKGWHWVGFAKACVELPCLFALGFAALFMRRRTWLLAVAFVGLALVCISSRVYVFRMIYLWPYALVGVALFAASLTGKGYARSCMLLGVMGLVSWGWSVGLRNTTEYFMRGYRDYDKLRTELIREIGCDARIYMYCDHPYYIGRELGWQMYRYQYDDPAHTLFGKVDYVLEEEQMLDEGKIKKITSFGFAKNRIICVDVRKPSNAIERFLVKHGRAHAYGPYRLFVRTRQSTLKGK